MIAKRLLGQPVARALAVVSVAGLPLLVLAAPNVDRLSPTSAVGPDVDVNRWTIDGGGAMFSTGGVFDPDGDVDLFDFGAFQGAFTGPLP